MRSSQTTEALRNRDSLLPRVARKAQSKEEKETNIALGRRIASFRKQHGLTQTELAEKLDLSQTVISSYEIGRLRPHPDLLLKLADILDLTTDELLGRAKPKNGEGGAVDRRFLRRLKLVKGLPKRDQDALLRTIDAFIAARDA